MVRYRKSWIALAAGIALAAAILLALGQYLSVYAHRQLTQALREHYQSDVQVRSIRVSLLPPFSATLEDLEFRHHGRRDVPPLIAIRRASASVGILGLLQSPKRIHEVTLEGLEIQVPPRADRKPDDDRADSRPDRQPRSPFAIASIVADGTTLRVLPRKPGKQPLEFNIRRLRLHSVGVDRPMEFDAELRNAKPPGIVRSHGRQVVLPETDRPTIQKEGQPRRSRHPDSHPRQARRALRWPRRRKGAEVGGRSVYKSKLTICRQRADSCGARPEGAVGGRTCPAPTGSRESNQRFFAAKRHMARPSIRLKGYWPVV